MFAQSQLKQAAGERGLWRAEGAWRLQCLKPVFPIIGSLTVKLKLYFDISKHEIRTCGSFSIWSLNHLHLLHLNGQGQDYVLPRELVLSWTSWLVSTVSQTKWQFPLLKADLSSMSGLSLDPGCKTHPTSPLQHTLQVTSENSYCMDLHWNCSSDIKHKATNQAKGDLDTAFF